MCALRFGRLEKNSLWLVEWASCAGIQMHRHDAMHILYKCGVCSDLVGSLLAELCETDGLFDGRTFEEQLISASVKFAKWRETTKVSMHRASHFNPARVKRRSKLQYASIADTYKCHDVKTMAMWLTSFMREEFLKRHAHGTLTDYDKLRMTCIGSLMSYWTETRQAGPLLSESERISIHRHLRSFCQCYNHLSATANSQHHCLYRMRPKFHALLHVCLSLEQGNLENPASWECWADEDLVGKTAALNHKCHSSTVMTRSSQRYVGLLLSMCDMLRIPRQQ